MGCDSKLVGTPQDALRTSGGFAHPTASPRELDSLHRTAQSDGMIATTRPAPADHAAPVVVMHNRDRADAGIDIMQDIAAFFSRSLEIAAQAGIAENQLVLDPGIGFGKTPEQSLTVLARLDELRGFGFPLLVGASRKRFISTIA